MRELLASLPDAELFAGQGGLENQINTISFIDSPSSTDWLNGGEVILTTAFLYREDAEKLVGFVRKLVDMGVVALGIKIGRYIDELPHAAIAYADEMDFPIFRIRYDSVWSEIFSVFHTLRLDKKNESSILNTEMVTFDKLFRSSTWGNEAIHTHFLKCIRVPAVIVDERYNILCSNGGPAMEFLEEYCERRRQHRVADESPKSFVSQAKQMHKIFDMELYSEERLVLCTDDGEDIPGNELVWVVSLYESIRKKNKFMQDAPALWKNYILECVAGGAGDNYKDYAQLLQLDKSRSATVLVFYGKDAFAARDEFMRLFRGAAASREVMVHTADIDGESVVVYAKTTPSEGFQDYVELRSMLQKALLRCDGLRVSVGDFIDRMEDLKQAYGQARTAQQMGSELMPDEEIVFCRDLNIVSLLREQGFGYDEISFLNEQITSFDACRTLEIYLESGNIKRAAESSFIHDNTMRYRIQKIEQCLNMDLNKPFNRLNLMLKLKLWKLA